VIGILKIQLASFSRVVECVGVSGLIYLPSDSGASCSNAEGLKSRSSSAHPVQRSVSVTETLLPPTNQLTRPEIRGDTAECYDLFAAEGGVVGISAIGLGIEQDLTDCADVVGVNVGNAARTKSVHELVGVIGEGEITLFHRKFLGL
jgi:hypothetical protein